MTDKPLGQAKMQFEIPRPLVILETDDWILNHRVDSVLPGYLMLGARTERNDLSSMRHDALAELGTLLATAQSSLIRILSPDHIYISRYGHTAGHTLHFHMIPICGWLKAQFFENQRYRLLEEFSYDSSLRGERDTDGAELTLFVWREFCENPEPPPVQGPSIQEVVENLRTLMGSATNRSQ